MPHNFGDEISKLNLEPLKPQAKANQSKTKSKYVIQDDDNTICPQCHSKVNLLCRKDCNVDKPWFYICWHCHLIFEVGKGEVKREA